ncbi:hypothetical protein GCM10011393_13450 [Sphingopyxis bauzanensis]|nr:hypothetical protein GCM10011393_13450 [Sphingopyxis bauzanensis]
MVEKGFEGQVRNDRVWTVDKVDKRPVEIEQKAGVQRVQGRGGRQPAGAGWF